MGGVFVSLEAGRPHAQAFTGRATPASLGLADVVCSAGELSTKSLVRQFDEVFTVVAILFLYF